MVTPLTRKGRASSARGPLPPQSGALCDALWSFSVYVLVRVERQSSPICLVHVPRCPQQAVFCTKTRGTDTRSDRNRTRTKVHLLPSPRAKGALPTSLAATR
ncbi:uncharacterized protein LOC118757784 isoform X2 [Ochotona princeps]|uniref:uncharacterized protein LOC118757784 isoform X2 n=1 Tax=Ochotona princeps TaxID=9978 RepID=UPI0027152DC1|nr:uncharacterized protein LOC118757784 isoform X2 [Ochotona princeps]